MSHYLPRNPDPPLLRDWAKFRKPFGLGWSNRTYKRVPLSQVRRLWRARWNAGSPFKPAHVAASKPCSAILIHGPKHEPAAECLECDGTGWIS